MKLQSKVTVRFDANVLQELAERSHPLYEERQRQELRRRRLTTLACAAAGMLVGALFVVLFRALQ